MSQDAAHEISPSSDKNSASESIYTGPSQIFSSEHSGRSGHGCGGHGCGGHDLTVLALVVLIMVVLVMVVLVIVVLVMVVLVMVVLFMVVLGNYGYYYMAYDHE